MELFLCMFPGQLSLQRISNSHKNLTSPQHLEMLSSTSIEGLVAAVAKTITSGVPGTSVCVVGKDGRPIFQHAAGKRGVDSHEAMTPENVFWVASCTKMITGIACMQLVEQGKMELDSVEFVEKLAPELREVKVLTTTGELVDKTRGITVRMLLTHTAGFGYAFFNNKLRKYNYPIGYGECDLRFVG